MNTVEWVLVAVVAFGIVIALLGWDRYRGSRQSGSRDGAAQPTSEVFIDPDTGKRMRVWYNPTTGQREYHAE